MHVPFCRRKCRYCAFYSQKPKQQDVEGYLKALRLEVSSWKRDMGTKPVVDSLYIGGGTPTCLTPEEWTILIEILENGLSFSEGAEVSVEANPDSLHPRHLELWRSWRIGRISLGIQSFSPLNLQWLGRLHDEKQAVSALELCANRGFAVSGDLIFGIPGQKLHSWHDDLRVLTRFAGHVSVYQLTAEPGTPLEGETVATQAQGYPFYRFAQWYLARKGYLQYEVASFAKTGQWCRHNLSYWSQGNVLALGPSAWGYLDGLRYRNAGTLADYLRQENEQRWEWTESLYGEKRAREAAILALRTRWGIRWRFFRRRFGVEIAGKIGGILEGLPRDLFVRKNGCISFSQKGFRLANSIWERLV
ncbi:MAG: radical SAM family heme chaperone HemW [Synergistales bacterium]